MDSLQERISFYLMRLLLLYFSVLCSQHIPPEIPSRSKSPKEVKQFNQSHVAEPFTELGQQAQRETIYCPLCRSTPLKGLPVTTVREFGVMFIHLLSA